LILRAVEFVNLDQGNLDTRLEIISVQVSEKARSRKFRHHIQTKWFFPIPHTRTEIISNRAVNIFYLYSEICKNHLSISFINNLNETFIFQL
jgi:hypothetical protein